MTHPRTLVVDCGGTGLKAAVFGADGTAVTERVVAATPYPCPPHVLAGALIRLVEPLPPYDRVSVGLPGVIRAGCVLTTPHYVTEAGPFTPVRDDLVEQWRGFDFAAALAGALGRAPVAVHDAELHGLAVASGAGYEVMLTLGTGLGFAHLWNGTLLPKVEMSAHPLADGRTYDELIGDHARRAVGDERWNARVAEAVRALQRVFWWDRCYLGGGNSTHVSPEPGAGLTIVGNEAGLVGGVALWRTPGVRAVDADGRDVSR